MADESSKIPEKTVEQIFDERYPLDKWEDSNYSILDKFSMRGRKGFVTGAAGGLGRNAAAALAQAGADVALVDLPSQEDKLTELVEDMREGFGTKLQQAVLRGVDGVISRDWKDGELSIEIEIPLASLR